MPRQIEGFGAGKYRGALLWTRRFRAGNEARRPRREKHEMRPLAVVKGLDTPAVQRIIEAV